jgi:hypothetical protein
MSSKNHALKEILRYQSLKVKSRLANNQQFIYQS